jgi:magnesium transporter
VNKEKKIQFDIKNLNSLFGSRTKVLKAKTSELKLSTTSVIETTWHDFNELTFLCIGEPEQSTLENINKKYKFHHLAIEDCLSEYQRSKLEQYKDYIHLILQVPVYEKNQVVTVEVDIFVSETYVVLVHWNNLPHLTDFINMIVIDGKTKKECMEKGPGYLLYKIVDLLVLNSFPLIDKIEKRVRVLESKVFDENSLDSRKIVREIASVRRDIMSFHRIIKPQIPVIKSLERIKEKYIIHDLELYFGDIADYISKQWEVISDQNELIINLNSTNESLISVKANNIMKTLTIISVIILPLTLISGIYGMNIHLPLADFKYAFEIIMGFMIISGIFMLVFFKKKNWI